MIEIILKKRCTKCGLEKPRDEFSKDKRKTDGLQSHCKACVKAYREANKDKMKAYREANKDKRKAYIKAYYEANKEKLKAQSKSYYEANKEKLKAQAKAQNKAYREANKYYYKAYKKAWQNKRRKEDPIHKLKDNMRRRVGSLLNGKKSKRTEEIIGCSYGQLYLHLNYDNLEEPSHDHIIPLSWADTEKELYALFRWENLQGMEHNENIEKGNRFCDKKRADQVAKIHPNSDLIKQILSRQTETKNQYIKD